MMPRLAAPPMPRPPACGAVVVTGAIGWVHNWLGVWPFG